MEQLVTICLSLMLGTYIGYRLHASIVRPALLQLDQYRDAYNQLRARTTPDTRGRQQTGQELEIEMELQADGSYAMKR